MLQGVGDLLRVVGGEILLRYGLLAVVLLTAHPGGPLPDPVRRISDDTVQPGLHPQGTDAEVTGDDTEVPVGQAVLLEVGPERFLFGPALLAHPRWPRLAVQREEVDVGAGDEAAELRRRQQEGPEETNPLTPGGVLGCVRW